MPTIGQFAQLTGLTVKALRHYDAAGVLTPARVDETTGYRHYSPDQVRDAATVALLRSMEVPLPTIREVLAAPDRMDDVLDAFEAERRRLREREDATAAEARTVLEAYRRPTEVTTREIPERPWVGLRHVVDIENMTDDAAEVDTFNSEFDAFVRDARERGLDPAGHWWLEFRPGASESQAVLVWGVPVATLPREPLTSLPEGTTYLQGIDPARREAVVRVTAGEDGGPEITDLTTAPHPAVLALLEADVDGDGITRQVYTPVDGGIRLEVVAPVPR